MPRFTLRARVLVIATVVSCIIAGIAAYLTFTLGSETMRTAISGNAERTVAIVKVAVEYRLEDASVLSTSAGTTETAVIAAVQRTQLDRLRLMLTKAGVTNVNLAIYDKNLDVLWYTSPRAVLPHDAPTRRRVQATKTMAQQATDVPAPFASLFGRGGLPHYVFDAPLTFPDGSIGVLTVSYEPGPEDVIESNVRLPLLGVAAISAILTVVLMYTAIALLLRRLDSLRRGAESIEAGRFDERLPVTGNDEITDLALTVNSMVDRLERRNLAQMRFVADASHELATPVAGIRGYTSILRAWGAEDPKVRDEAIDAIDRESRRMMRLTGDLLSLLHADQGLVLKTDRVDINALARQLIATTASRWLEKDIEYCGPDEAPLVVMGDPERIEDVLSILLENASKYTPPGGSITVSTKRQRDSVVIAVADTGQGIAEDDLARIFERFYRGESSRAEGESGFGLGLAIAKSVVLAMGGEISVVSEVGRGTAFTLTLPRKRT